ncbi:flagellar hook-length control protein FliK [Zestomonas thermotolerans]|uniref:flagellar hook-length control protein FliK n=1 Tax=Zestomonas thermotolerans TaxID=157784 RepID=UPI000382BF45|nr:flagellar hook-length control protein FliK [Pseudomonas thermotolerans]
MTQAVRSGAAGEGQAAPQASAELTGLLDGAVPGGDFGEQLALSAEETLPVGPWQLSATTELPAPPRAELEQPAELAGVEVPDAGQWLLIMLDQQALNIQAREAQPQAAVDGDLPPQETQLPMLPQAQAALVEPQRGISGEHQSRGPAVQLPQHQPALADASIAPVPLQAVAQPLAIELPDAPLSGQPEVAALQLTQPSAAPLAGQAQPTQAAATPLEQRLVLQAPEAKWGEQMLNALRESVELQLRSNVQQASIRLDPPELGSLEILLSHESGRLNVQITAGQSEVARLVQQTSERLRQELTGQHFVQVEVQVAADGHSGRQQSRREAMVQLADEPVRAASVVEEGGKAAARTSDVLVTV